MRILGIDYGRKRIGVAVSDPTGVIAQGLPTITYRDLSDGLARLADLIEEFEVTRMVVGLPRNLKGETGFAAHAATRFAGTLKDRFEIPILLWDERLTSTMAEKTLRQFGKSPSKHKEKIDQIAATILLQNFLDLNNTST